jgi:uncharacterized protein YbjT (DUF2867 family)
MKTILVIGGSGLVGQQIIAQALVHQDVGRVVAPTRRPLAAHEKLFNPIVDFTQLSAEADWWQADATLCTLGTTRKQAGSDAAFRKIDHDYVIAAASLTRNADTPVFVYNSSLGANAAAGSLYLRVKGETEQDLQNFGFVTFSVVRPSLLDGGPRPDFRLGETFALWFARVLAPLIPKRYRAVPVCAVATAMLAEALQARPGKHIIESDQLHKNFSQELNSLC